MAVPKRYVAYMAAFSRMASVRQVYDYLCVTLRLRAEDARLWHVKDEVNIYKLCPGRKYRVGLAYEGSSKKKKKRLKNLSSRPTEVLVKPTSDL
jgi:hypothetical protein